MKGQGSEQNFKKHTPAKAQKGDFSAASKRGSSIKTRENSPHLFMKPANSKLKYPKPNDDISQILDDRSSSLKQGSTTLRYPGQKESELESRGVVIRQDSVQGSARGRDSGTGAHGSGSKGAIDSEARKKTLAATSTADPKYRLVKAGSGQTSERNDSCEGSYGGGGLERGPFRIHDTSNYTIINIDAVLTDPGNSKQTSHRLIAMDEPAAKIQIQEHDHASVITDRKGPKDPKMLEWAKNNEKFLVAQPALSCSPGITNVLNNRARQFASTERTKKVQSIKLEEQKAGERH